MNFRNTVLLGAAIVFGVPAVVGIVLWGLVNLTAGIVGAVFTLLAVVAIGRAKMKKQQNDKSKG